MQRRFERRGLMPLTLEAKEGLALLNGTQQMTAVGVLTLLRAEQALRTATVTASMSVEALLGTDVAFAAAYHADTCRIRVNSRSRRTCATCCATRS